MIITPLFFLPLDALRWAYDQAYYEHLMDTPFVLLFVSLDRLGVSFPYRGDEVIWTWPWRRKGLAPYISIGFTGTGAFGDARYWTLKELDRDWQGYYDACTAPYEDEALAKALEDFGAVADRATKSFGEFTVTIETFNKPGSDGAIGRMI